MTSTSASRIRGALVEVGYSHQYGKIGIHSLYKAQQALIVTSSLVLRISLGELPLPRLCIPLFELQSMLWIEGPIEGPYVRWTWDSIQGLYSGSYYSA